MSTPHEFTPKAPAASVAALLRSATVRLSVLSLAALVACGGGQDTAQVMSVEEDATALDTSPIIDGRLKATASAEEVAQAAQATVAGFMPRGTPEAGTQGMFGPLLPWPLMPIHQVLLPDGRVLFYGSDINGQQGGGLHYAVWDPSLGTGEDAFDVLPNTVGTNLFCAGQAQLPDTGDVFIVGGTLIYDGIRGLGVSDSNTFQASANTLVAQAPMAFKRWYPTLISLADGRQLAMGGRIDHSDGGEEKVAARDPLDPDSAPASATYATTPELWDKATGWHTLDGAKSDIVFGPTDQDWYYPRAWVMPAGKVFVLGNNGSMYVLNPAGTGTLSQLKGKIAVSNARIQSVMFQPGKILTVRQDLSAAIVDINGKQPAISGVAGSARYRQFGNATLLADGQVWFNGGSADGNALTNDYMVSEMWNPTARSWTDMASASIARLYHSSALLLPDASVITGGGGDPGPLRNLNAEIYYPPYLYLKDGSGNLAPRPAITSAPDVLGWGQAFTIQVNSGTAVSRVTLVRTGVVTHDFNSNQRFQELNFTQKATTIKLKTPASSGVAPPGYYMLFVFDGNGVPSVAKVFRIGN